MQNSAPVSRNTIFEALFVTLGKLLADALDLDVKPRTTWDPEDSATINFARYMRREVLGRISTPLVWGLGAIHCVTQQQPAPAPVGKGAE